MLLLLLLLYYYNVKTCDTIKEAINAWDMNVEADSRQENTF
jgi:hypothetical protein